MTSALRWFSREAGLRFLARRKATFAVAILTMALALGANAVVFSALKTFLFSASESQMRIAWSGSGQCGTSEGTARPSPKPIPTTT